jgi:hypothetical protein
MTDRRSALKAIVAAAAAGASADARAGGLRVGVIGAGWFGKLNLNALSAASASDTQVVRSGVDGVILPPPLCEVVSVGTALKEKDVAAVAVAPGRPLPDCSCLRIDGRGAC